MRIRSGYFLNRINFQLGAKKIAPDPYLNVGGTPNTKNVLIGIYYLSQLYFPLFTFSVGELSFTQKCKTVAVHIIGEKLMRNHLIK